MTFVYVSGAGTDSSEKGRSMWARVKGRTENALLALPFQAKVHVPPRLHPTDARHPVEDEMVPRDLRGRHAALFAPQCLFPRSVHHHRARGRAMLAVAKRGAARTLLDNAEINALAAGR